MRFIIFISTLLYILKHINGDLIITCSNDDCNSEDMGLLDSFLSKLNAVIDGNDKTMKYLEDLNERIDNNFLQLTKEIESLKAMENKQDSVLIGLNKDISKEENTKSFYPIEIENSNEISLDEDEIEDSQENARNDFKPSRLKIPNEYNSWITIQRRQDGSVDFYRNWNDYKQGFGNKDGEFFLGLDEIHNLTKDRPYELLIILENFNDNLKYAHYDKFLIGNEDEKYQLKSLGKYQGNAGDYLRPHENMYFSTKDRDNDIAPGESCAIKYQGAWWFYICMTSNLNGPFRYSPYLLGDRRGQGITWGDYGEIQYPYKFSQMMIRPKKNKIIH